MRPHESRELAQALPAHPLMAVTLAVVHAPPAEPAEPDEGYLLDDEDSAVPNRTLEHLDWASLCEVIAERCCLEESAEIARRLPLLEARALVMRRLHEIDEMMKLLRAGEQIPLRSLDEVRKPLERVLRGSVLDVEALRALSKAARCSEKVRRFFHSRSEENPLLWQCTEGMADVSPIIRALDGIFDPSGELSDKASPELGGLRRRLRGLHDKMRQTIEERVHAKDTEAHLQDSYYTLREGRYVLPVKAQSRQRISGIVHATSASGQTVFIEPSDMVVLNNDLRMAEFAVAAEIQRILERLSRLVSEHAEGMEDNIDVLVYLDVVKACADFSAAIDATVPSLSEHTIGLRQARHPLLTLRFAETGREVIANDIMFGDDQPVLVISGSNAGGKTVTLKTLGLFSLMLRAGLPISAAAGSALPLFMQIYTDIGDEQSIEQDTSTFSAHVLNLRGFVERVGGASLVLLDEPFAGTDPTHAAALAMALLEHLRASGAQVVVTTHLDKIKAFALEQPWMGNASVGFDVDALRPTFELHLGAPGGSCALQIARRLSLAPIITERAAELLEDNPQMSIETILRELEDERQRLRRERETLQRERIDAEKLNRRLEAQLEKARKGQLDALDEETRTLRHSLRRARRLVGRHIKDLQDANRPGSGSSTQADLQAKSEALRALEDVPKTVEQKLKERLTPPMLRGPVGELEVGATVWSKTYQREAVLLLIDPERREGQLEMGHFKVRVGLKDLVVSAPPAPPEQPNRGRKRKRRRAKDPSRMAGGSGVVAAPEDKRRRPLLPQTSENTCDLRGLTGLEAIERLELFLDGCYRRNVPSAYIIHGHGTGILKRAVRSFVPNSRYIEHSRAGEYGEGGDGITVVWLAES